MAKKKEDKNEIDDVINQLNTRYGKGTVMSLEEKVSVIKDAISSGSLSMDYVTLGVGGFVKGKLYELMGWEGTGKSSICGHAAASCQKMGGTVLYVDAENALDKSYFRKLGVDTSKLLISQPYCGEEGFQVALDMIKSNSIDLVIIDSDSALIPKKVIDGEVGEVAIGRKAILNSNVYPKLKGALVRSKTCVIVVSQYREKIGVMFGNPTTTQGGHALKYYTDCRLEITKTVLEEEGVKKRILVKVNSSKNKIAAPYRRSSFQIVFGKGIDVQREIVELAIDHDIIKRSGSWYSYEDVKLGQGEKTVRTLMQDNIDLYEELKEKVINLITNEQV